VFSRRRVIHASSVGIVTATSAPARRSGFFAPPTVPIDGPTVLEQLEHDDYVWLREFSERIGWTDQGRRYAVREGLLEAEKIRNAPGQPYRITSDEACTLLLAALLALAAGVAIAVMLRGVKGAGLTGDAAAAVIRNMSA
jgi:hypothetical protein